MDDALGVSRMECVENLGGVMKRPVEWQRTGQRFAVDKLHHEIMRTDVVSWQMCGWLRAEMARLLLEVAAELDCGELQCHETIGVGCRELSTPHPCRRRRGG